MELEDLNKEESKHYKYVNNFFAKLNKYALDCSDSTKKFVSFTMNTLIEKKKQLISNISEKGIPDDLPMLRAYIWKILLNLLPEDPSLWGETLKKKRIEYHNYRELIEAKLKKEIEEKKYKSIDELEQIIKDAYRTNTSVPFFFEPTNKDNLQNDEEHLKQLKKRKNCTINSVNEIYYNEKEYELHVDVLKRILFIHTKFCAAISYHQGMNELIAPIYYCFSYDKTYKNETHEDIEADTYWCFHYLMSQVGQSFVSANNEGIKIKSSIFFKCLKIVDIDISNKLKELNIPKEYYCHKWFLLLFSQEFQLKDLLKIWDLIFSKEDVYYYVIYIGIAFLMLKREFIVKGDMIVVLKELGNYKNINIDELIQKAKEIRKSYSGLLDDIILKTTEIINDV